MYHHRTFGSTVFKYPPSNTRSPHLHTQATDALTTTIETADRTQPDPTRRYLVALADGLLDDDHDSVELRRVARAHGPICQVLQASKLPPFDHARAPEDVCSGGGRRTPRYRCPRARRLLLLRWWWWSIHSTTTVVAQLLLLPLLTESYIGVYAIHRLVSVINFRVFVCKVELCVICK